MKPLTRRNAWRAAALALFAGATPLVAQEREDRTLLTREQMTSIVNEASGERAMHSVLGLVPYQRVRSLAFAEWVTVFAGDEKLTTALLDRLAHHATVITTQRKSCRMRKRRAAAS